MDLLSSHGELGTARRRNHLGNIGIIENPNPSTCEGELGCASCHLSEWLDFVWAAGSPIASEIQIAGFAEVVELESLDG